MDSGRRAYPSHRPFRYGALTSPCGQHPSASRMAAHVPGWDAFYNVRGDLLSSCSAWDALILMSCFFHVVTEAALVSRCSDREPIALS